MEEEAVIQAVGPVAAVSLGEVDESLCDVRFRISPLAHPVGPPSVVGRYLLARPALRVRGCPVPGRVGPLAAPRRRHAHAAGGGIIVRRRTGGRRRRRRRRRHLPGGIGVSELQYETHPTVRLGYAPELPPVEDVRVVGAARLLVSGRAIHEGLRGRMDDGLLSLSLLLLLLLRGRRRRRRHLLEVRSQPFRQGELEHHPLLICFRLFAYGIVMMKTNRFYERRMSADRDWWGGGGDDRMTTNDHDASPPQKLNVAPCI